ncbi:MAG: hypothetical protein ABTQ73_05055 [Caldilineales bacterium]
MAVSFFGGVAGKRYFPYGYCTSNVAKNSHLRHNHGEKAHDCDLCHICLVLVQSCAIK